MTRIRKGLTTWHSKRRGAFIIPKVQWDISLSKPKMIWYTDTHLSQLIARFPRCAINMCNWWPLAIIASLTHLSFFPRVFLVPWINDALILNLFRCAWFGNVYTCLTIYTWPITISVDYFSICDHSTSQAGCVFTDTDSSHGGDIGNVSVIWYSRIPDWQMVSLNTK